MNIYDALILKALGGGGGTTVVANPEGEATDELEKIQVGNDIYGIPKDYEELDNKPQINGETLSGNKTASELGLQAELDGTQTVSGNPITVTDAEPMNAESVVVELEPKQDLHGYDAPWVGGSGKNLLPMTVDGIKSANTIGMWSANTYTLNGVTFEILTDSANNVEGIKVNGTTIDGNISLSIPTPNIVEGTSVILNGCPSGGYDNYRIWVGTPNYADVASDFGTGGTAFNYNNVARIWIQIINDTTVSNLVFKPMIRLATETDSTFAPYSNICPITGYSEVNVERVGKNLCPYDSFSFTSANTWCSLVGEPAADLLDGSPVTLKSGTYYANLTDFINIDNMQIADSSGNLILNSTDGSFTLPSDDTIYIRVKQINTSTTTSSKLQIELGNQATTYEPYQDNTYTIDLDGTKYGGTLDVTEGVLTVTHSFVQTTWGEMTNPQVSGDYTFKTIPNLNCKSTGDAVGNLCNLTDNEASNLNQNVHYWCQENLGAVVSLLSDTSNDTVIQIYYELATPLTIQLTPTQIQMLENTNNISTDGTNITLKYQPNNVIGECKAYADEKCSEVLPPLPTTDGTYHLSCEVTSGVGVLSWVSDS